MQRRIHFFVSGNVSGVFFRSFIKEHADEFSLKGFTRNTVDGKVETIVEGETRAINKLIDKCRKGPKFAKVSDVKIVEETFKDEFKDFTILR